MVVVFNGGVSDGGDVSSSSGAAQIESREQFGVVLTAIRQAAGLSIRKVAEEACVPTPTLGGWYAGKAVPAIDAAAYLENVLKACGSADRFEELWSAANRLRDTARSARPANSPYRSLAPYRPEDADLFFGREDLVVDLADRVAAGLSGVGPQLIGMLGASGSGKSSLLQAGLLTRLDVPAHWLAPGPDPETRLDEAFEILSGRDEGGAVLIVDQAEELWTYTDATASQGAPRTTPALFIERLADLTETGVVVVFALRADFFERALEIPLLQRALTTDAVAVGPMTREQLEQAIAEPAKARGDITVEPALVTMLLQELSVAGGGAHDPGALPLLSHALHETWTRRTTTSKLLTVEHYRATGGIRGAVGQTADNVWEQLDSEQQTAAERLFTRAVHRGDTGLARITIRPTELDWSDIDRTATDEVIARFVAARLLTSTGDGVQITHEALLHAWKRLRGWIDDDTAGHTLHLRLAEYTRTWDHADPSTLLSAARTEEYQLWIGNRGRSLRLTVAEDEYIAASTKHHTAIARAETWRLRRLYLLSGALFLVAIVSIATTVFAMKQSDRADAARDLAVSRQAALKAIQLRGRDPSLAQQLAMAAYQVAPTREARSALLESTATNTPRRIPTIATDHTGHTVALSSNERFLAVKDWGSGPMKVIDRLIPGRITPSDLPQPGYGVIAFRPNSSILAIVGADKVHLWDYGDVINPRHLITVTGPPGQSLRPLVVWSPDGNEITSVDQTGAIVRWSVGAQLQLTPLTPLASAGTDAAAPKVTYSSDGRWLARADRGATLQVWDRNANLSPRTVEVAPEVDPSMPIRDLVSDHTSSLIAVGYADFTVLVDLAPSPSPVVRPRIPMNGRILGFSSDGSTLLTTNYGSGQIESIDIAAGTRKAFQAPGIVEAAFLTQTIDPALITVSYDGFVREWAAPDPTEPETGGDLSWIRAAVDQGVAVVSADGPPRQLDISELPRVHDRGPRLATTPAETLGTYPYQPLIGPPLAISDDGSTAAWSSGSQVFPWDLRTADEPRPVAPPVDMWEGEVLAIALTPTGTVLFTGDSEQVISTDLQHPSRSRDVVKLAQGELVGTIAVSPDGRMLAVGTTFNLRIFELTPTASGMDARLVSSSEGAAFGAVFSRDSSMLVAFNPAPIAKLKLWDTTDIRDIRQLEPLTGPIQHFTAVAFDSSETHLAAASDNEVWVWKLSTDRVGQAELSAILSGPKAPTGLVYGPGDSTTLTAIGRDEDIRTWQVDTQTIIDGLCRYPLGTLTELEWRQHVPDAHYRNPCRQ